MCAAIRGHLRAHTCTRKLLSMKHTAGVQGCVGILCPGPLQTVPAGPTCSTTERGRPISLFLEDHSDSIVPGSAARNSENDDARMHLLLSRGMLPSTRRHDSVSR